MSTYNKDIIIIIIIGTRLAINFLHNIQWLILSCGYFNIYSMVILSFKVFYEFS